MTRREYWEASVGESASFRTADVARICEVTQRHVQRWIASGRLFALGSTEEERYEARVPREALIEFLVRRTQPGRYPPYVEV